MSSLSKYASEPPLWFLDVNGRRVELDTDSLYNQMAFQKACMEKLNLVPPTLRKQDWEQLLNALLKEMVETEQITEGQRRYKYHRAIHRSVGRVYDAHATGPRPRRGDHGPTMARRG
jgi:hypothetical protein